MDAWFIFNGSKKLPLFMDFLVNYSNLTNHIWPCKHSWWHGWFQSDLTFFFRMEKNPSPKPLPITPNPRSPDIQILFGGHRHELQDTAGTQIGLEFQRINFKGFFVREVHPLKSNRLDTGYPKKWPIFEKGVDPPCFPKHHVIWVSMLNFGEVSVDLILVGCYRGVWWKII